MKFLRIYLITLFVLLTAVSASAQENSLLWKIEGPDGTHTSWLYGTMHIICSEHMEIPAAVDDALSQSGILALELDMTDPNMASEMMALGINPDGVSVIEFMSDAEAEMLNNFFAQNYGVGLDQLGTMRPFMLASMAMMPMISCEGSQESVDNYLMMAAMEHEIPVEGLETVEFQVGLFDDIPMQEQIDELVKMVKDPKAGEEQFRNLSVLYASQDVDAMYQFITNDEYWQEYKDILLDTRNIAWIPVIEELVAEQSSFIAVGAGHLAGENGVINLLRARGFTVTAVH